MVADTSKEDTEVRISVFSPHIPRRAFHLFFKHICQIPVSNLNVMHCRLTNTLRKSIKIGLNIGMMHHKVNITLTV